jgi:hypothetical protein
VLGGGFGARRSDAPLAAERGVTVAVPANTATEAALRKTHPVRIDLVAADGQPITTLQTEDPDPVVRVLGRHAADEDRRD